MGVSPAYTDSRQDYVQRTLSLSLWQRKVDGGCGDWQWGDMTARILVIDDNKLLLRVINMILSQSGFQVTVADSGQKGLALALTHKPDLVLSDVTMPDMTGYEVCRHVRAHPDLGDTRFILLSALSGHQDRAAGFAAGADEYLFKPIMPDELLCKIREVLTRS